MLWLPARCVRPHGTLPRALALFALAVLAVAETPAPARAAEPDYSGYQALLTRYVQVLPRKKGEPWDARFDYEQLFIDEKIWQGGRAERLTNIQTQLLAVTPGAMSARERTAWALNAYNFLAIEQMTRHLLVPGRRYQRYDSPRQVRSEGGSFFAAPIALVNGVSYSLTGFERRFVYGDTASLALADGTHPREVGGDPRLQFALTKAALCGGLVMPWVFRADSLEAQLDRAVRFALATPRWIRVDAATASFTASNRFFEERADLGGPEMPGLMPLLTKYGPPKLQQLIKSKKVTKPAMFFEPDWKLNQFEHPSPPLPGAVKDTTRKG